MALTPPNQHDFVRHWRLLQIGEPLDGTVGCSVTVSILDEEMKHLWDAPVHTAGAALGDVMQQA